MRSTTSSRSSAAVPLRLTRRGQDEWPGMPSEGVAAAALAVAALVTYLATPFAIRLAVRTSFFDVPVGYKGHDRPTPYLGGVAILAGLLAALLATGGTSGADY